MRTVNPLNPIPGLKKISADDTGQLVNQEAKQLAKGLAGLAGSSLLVHDAPDSPAVTMQVSATAQTIHQAISQVPHWAANAAYQASAVVSDNPQSATHMARALKQAIDFSGLFYESHLRAFTLHQRPLTAIWQEPHNQPNGPTPQLLAQQLALLDHPQLVWQGNVWPHQPMTWQIRWPEQAHENRQQAVVCAAPLASDITLTLPSLGKVVASIVLQHGRLRVRLQSDDPHTRETLQAKSQQLARALQASGQTLESLTVRTDEPSSTP